MNEKEFSSDLEKLIDLLKSMNATVSSEDDKKLFKDFGDLKREIRSILEHNSVDPDLKGAVLTSLFVDILEEATPEDRKIYLQRHNRLINTCLSTMELCD